MSVGDHKAGAIIDLIPRGLRSRDGFEVMRFGSILRTINPRQGNLLQALRAMYDCSRISGL